MERVPFDRIYQAFCDGYESGEFFGFWLVMGTDGLL